ncbi:uncharacterized protein LOC106181407 isoform X1 [Lingula anatina]|uniref:Uncharacterized protein LOC106181407 isoform X1 n=1 Tax=Lingula anatina TaxID=7574 RepID=A0A1S3KFJ7_LINAN|nr:uncharacterized protein LOC106181407 isoform X1 [Lingula anatina]|eukprot:XP_013421234.1 uncharacterized protein LOC106181407 isoform X1 [Lingula anatina]
MVFTIPSTAISSQFGVGSFEVDDSEKLLKDYQAGFIRGNCFFIDEQGESSGGKDEDALGYVKKKASFEEKLVGIKGQQIELALQRFKKYIEKKESWEMRQMAEQVNHIRHDQRLLEIDQRKIHMQRERAMHPWKDFTYEDLALANLERYLNKNLQKSCYLEKKMPVTLRYQADPNFVSPTVTEARKALRQQDFAKSLQKEKEKQTLLKEKNKQVAPDVIEPQNDQNENKDKLQQATTTSTFPSRSQSKSAMGVVDNSTHTSLGPRPATVTVPQGETEQTKLPGVEPLSKSKTTVVPGETKKGESGAGLQKYFLKVQLPTIEQVALTNKPSSGGYQGRDKAQKNATMYKPLPAPTIEPMHIDEDDVCVRKSEEEIARIMHFVLNMSREEGQPEIDYKPRPKTIASTRRREGELPIPKCKKVSQDQVKREARDVHKRFKEYLSKLERQKKAAEEGMLDEFVKALEEEKAEEAKQKMKAIAKKRWANVGKKKIQMEQGGGESQGKAKKKKQDPLLLQAMIAAAKAKQETETSKPKRGIPTHSQNRSMRHTATFKLRRMVDDLFKSRSTYEQQEYDKIKEQQQQQLQADPAQPTVKS